jgi:hypothetical protein
MECWTDEVTSSYNSQEPRTQRFIFRLPTIHPGIMQWMEQQPAHTVSMQGFEIFRNLILCYVQICLRKEEYSHSRFRTRL